MGSAPPIVHAMRQAVCRERRRQTREADLSTEQIGAQAPPWLSGKNGYHGRAPRGGGTSRPGSQAAECLRAPSPRVVPMERLRQRADFLAAASGTRAAGPAFVVQVRRRGDDGPPRIGFTVSRKVGTAVERNRVRRRLREIVRHSAAASLRAGHDYVLVGRSAALFLSFERLLADFSDALERLHGERGPRERSASRRGGGCLQVPRIDDESSL
jgi:ribonuclease P protein component